jgi:hypothetical protein
MSQQALVHNPFLMMISPEVVLAAVEKSERLGQLNRHLCRPLDRPTPTTAGRPAMLDDDAGDADESQPD